MDYETIIVGSGPAGLTAAIYVSRGGLKTGLVSGQERGGQLMLTTEVENFPGFPEGILGPELMERTINQAKRFGTDIIDDQVDKINQSKGHFILDLVSGQRLNCQSLIIASGASAKWLNIPGEKEFQGRGVSACATCDGFFFKDKVVTVVGGGDVAMEEASYLTKFASRVNLIHRRDKFRASKVMQDKVFNNPKIKIIWDSVVEEVLGQDKVKAVKVRNLKTNKIEVLTTDGFFVAIGHQPNTSFLKGLVELDEKGYIITANRLMAEIVQPRFFTADFVNKLKPKFDFYYPHSTSVEGVWAAGDVADYRYQQAVTAAGSGCAAGLELLEWYENQKS